MAARRIGKYVPDWVKLATKCPEAERPHYNRLRTNFENIKTQLDGVAPKPEPINWDLYAKNISKPGMVEAFKKAYGAVTVPYPIDTLTSKINEAEKEMETLAKESIEEANEAIALCEAELTKIRSMKPYEEMSIDEFLDLHPEIKKFVDEKMQSGEWPDRTL
ncbi:hypothetical protein pdam_00011817 [Pocillopora damicornis]|uniref:ATP synthase subunit d, mitochondrial n=1 Tax=Pocillopora damicornis TaxID=46731 RepID=A0A3M6TAV5_POCDA|nr:ATP synthase subunit d, mitochondrial-like [Pocillopora damicornis]RMX38418.1 hypothetical protein pdam_00011817 [Pocillopora damicornis]